MFCWCRVRSEALWSGVERPCSVGIRSEAAETSARGRLCGLSLVRSSRRQPSTTEGPGGGDLPQGGVVASMIR